MAVVYLHVRLKHEFGQDSADQFAPGQAEQGGNGKVGLEDQPLCAEGAIADRCQVVEVEIKGPPDFQFRLGPAQFLILYLQFDFMDAELVEDSLIVVGAKRRLSHGQGGESLLCLLAQSACGGFGFLVIAHFATLSEGATLHA